LVLKKKEVYDKQLNLLVDIGLISKCELLLVIESKSGKCCLEF